MVEVPAVCIFAESVPDRASLIVSARSCASRPLALFPLSRESSGPRRSRCCGDARGDRRASSATAAEGRAFGQKQILEAKQVPTLPEYTSKESKELSQHETERNSFVRQLKLHSLAATRRRVPFKRRKMGEFTRGHAPTRGFLARGNGGIRSRPRADAWLFSKGKLYVFKNDQFLDGRDCRYSETHAVSLVTGFFGASSAIGNFSALGATPGLATNA